MPLRSRLLAGLFVTLLAATGCDSNNPGSSLRDLDGTYSLDELIFDPQAGGLADADVGARLNLGAAQLQIFGADGDATLVTAFSGQGSRRTDLTATASRGRLTLSAVGTTDQDELADLLLPPTFSLAYDTGNTLTGTVSRTNVNLDAFDRDQYAGLTSVAGTLRIRFSRQ
jgi:hypothetical protein